MLYKSITSVAEEINMRVEGHPIGRLQQLRQELHGLPRVLTQKMFSGKSIFEDGGYAFHSGGRAEFQFNIGFETIESLIYLRHGIAFSLQSSRNLPSIDPLVPKISRFNEFLQIHKEKFSDFRMWHYDHGRSLTYALAPIPPENVKEGVFIFLGKLQQTHQIDFDLIIDDFNRLLFLYEYVEGAEKFPALTEPDKKFHFTPGCPLKPSKTKVSVAERQLDKLLRHNDLQRALHTHLSKQHGSDSVGVEQGTGNGTLVDVVLRLDGRFWFYEIKTGSSARACIREALSQLLEYSCWPGAQEAERLIIVGEPPLDKDAAAFLECLREKFSLPVYYQQLDMNTGRLI